MGGAKQQKSPHDAVTDEERVEFEQKGIWFMKHVVALACVYAASRAANAYYLDKVKSDANALHDQEKEESFRGVRTYGKVKLGGPYAMVDAETGRPVTRAQFTDKGLFTLLYFGYTHCPDICPEELEKMSDIVDLLEADEETMGRVQPIFVSCDPKRDSLHRIRDYLQDFHPKFMGLVGSTTQVYHMAKTHRTFFDTTEQDRHDDDHHYSVAERTAYEAAGRDYLVDHSIYYYLMDPNGQFMEVYSRENGASESMLDIKRWMQNYDANANAEKEKDQGVAAVDADKRTAITM